MDPTTTSASIAFVYGTLTDRDRVERVLGAEAFEFRGPAVLAGLHRVDGEYPTLAPGGSVEGRLLAVDVAGLAALDDYEGVPDLYVRVSVPLADGPLPDDVGLSPGLSPAGDGPAGGVDPPSGGGRLDGVESVETYVGDPARLGVADRVDWPDGSTFADRVSGYVSAADPAVWPLE